MFHFFNQEERFLKQISLDHFCFCVDEADHLYITEKLFRLVLLGAANPAFCAGFDICDRAKT